MGCSIESPLRESIRLLLKRWSHDLSMFLAIRRERHLKIWHEHFFLRTHVFTGRTMKSQHETCHDYDSYKCSDSEEVETTKDNVVEHPKPAGKFIEYPKLIDCDDQSQFTWIFTLFETFMFLYLLQKYTEHPCEENKKPFTQLLEDGKIFTPEIIDHFFDSMRTFLNDKYSQNMHNKQPNCQKECKSNLIQPSQEQIRKQNSGKSRTSGKKNRKQCVNISQLNTPAAQTSVKSDAPNNFQNPEASTERKHSSTLNAASIKSTDHPPSKGPSSPFPQSLPSPIERTGPSTTVAADAGSFEGADGPSTTQQDSLLTTTCPRVTPNRTQNAQHFPESHSVNEDQPEKREMVAKKNNKSQLQGGQNSLEVRTYGYDLKTINGMVQNSSKAESNSLRSGKQTQQRKDWKHEDLQSHLRALEEKIRALREKNRLLKKRVESLETGNQEILADLGQFIVEKAAKENEERKSKVLQPIICSKAQPADASGDIKDFRLGYPKESHANEIGSAEGDASAVTTPPDEQPVLGAEALDTASNNHQRKEIGAQGSSSFALKEKASGGEGNNESENVKGSNVLASASEEGINLSFSVQQDYSNETEYISLDHIPLQSVATLLYTNYKLLLVSQSQLLLSSDVMKLKDWAALNFSIENIQNSTDVLLQLDKKGVINASDLSVLRNFFESIIRFDLVYIIDEFLLGDYTLLHKISVMKKRDATKALQNPQHASRYTRALSSLRQTSLQGSTPARSAASKGSLRMITDPATLRKPENRNGAQSSPPQPRHQPLFPNTSTLSNANNPKPPSVIPNENQSSLQQRNLKSIASGFTEQSVVVVNGPIANERRTTAANPSTRKNASVTNSARNTQKFGNDTSKLSKFQPPESSVVSHTHQHGASRDQDLELESNWLCSHYKRHCYVKFECCDKFWPCHRCHNNQSTCGQKKLKSRDTQMVKCVYCKKVQPFGQFCCNCAAKFSSYFCGMCKHLTGNDDHPYHCDKCGICRIHGDRSFHCDVCGVCLDVQLRGNHKCRAGSAHDECCICLEDAFTGCQILPCSHKVHKECATQMIRSGITRCPICRESFAHKLERRPLQNSRKRSGK